jgi:putative nucleotidyltransferase with HDIG domain
MAFLMDIENVSATYEPEQNQPPSLREILVALSFALDMTEGAQPGHAIRSCLLAIRVGLQAGADAETVADLYYGCLLKDVGCSSNSARMCQIVGGDDRAVKAGAKLQDWRSPLKPQMSSLKLLWKEVLPEASFVAKSVRILKVAASQLDTAEELISLRCDRGATIVRKLGLPSGVARGVRHLDEHWDGGGYPQGLKGEAIPLISRLMCLAQHLDAFAMSQGQQRAIDTLIERSGRWFDPDLTNAAVRLHQAGHLWKRCGIDDSVEEARRAILDLHSGPEIPLSASDIDSICEAFADVVDAKSPFTFRHSMRVMEAATEIGRVMELPQDRLQLLRRAALLHDIGKLGISNTILDKPGQLTEREFAAVKEHPGLGFEILRRISSFGEIALLAREHHERLDGTGYPKRLKAKDLSLESRILSLADVYGALSEVRPYRRALSPAQVEGILMRDVPEKMDPICFEALQGLMLMDDWYLNESSFEPNEGRCNVSLSQAHAQEVFI